MAGSHSPGAAVDAVLRYLGFGYMQWGLFFITGAVWSADAISVMIISFLGPAVRCEWGVSPEGESLLGVGLFGGMLLFSPLWGALADAHGRRPVLLASAVITGAGGLAAAAAHGYWWLLAARVVVGAGLGAAPSSFTLFMEWVPPELRNIWMVLFSVWWTAGTVAEALLAQGLLNSHGWRAMLLASCAPQVLVVALYPCMPESPQLLLEHAEALERRAKATPALHPLPPHPQHPSQQGQGRAGQWRRRSTPPGASGGGQGPPPPGPVRLPQAQRSAAQLLAQAAAARARALGLLLSAAAWAGRPLPADCPLLRDLLPDTPGDCNAPHVDPTHTPHKCDVEGQGVTHAAEVLVLGAGEEGWDRRPDLLLVQGGGPAASDDGRGQQQGSAWAVAPPGVPQDPLPAAACCQPSGLRPPSLEIEGQAGVVPAYGGRAAAEQQAAGRGGGGGPPGLGLRAGDKGGEAWGGGGEGEEGEGSEEGEWRPLLQAGQGGGEGWEEAGAGEGGVRGAVRALGRVCWRSCSAAWHEASQHAARSVEALSAPSLSPLVGRLALVWLVMAAAYYGVSLMAAALHLDPAAPPPPPPHHTTPPNMKVDDLCSGPGGAVHLPPDTFTAVMVAASAELPAMMLCLMAVISWAAAAKFKATPPTPTPTNPITTTTSTAAVCSASAARRGRLGAAPSTKPALPSHLPSPPPSCETLAAAASSPDTTQQQQRLGRQGVAPPAAACLHHRSAGSQGHSRHQGLGGLGQRPWSSPSPHQPPPPCLSTAAGGGGWGGPMVRSSSAHWDQGLRAGGAGQASSWPAAVTSAAPDPTRPSSSPPSSASPLVQPARSSAPPLPGCPASSTLLYRQGGQQPLVAVGGAASMHLAAPQALPLDQGQQQPQAGGSLDPHQVLVVDAGGEQQQGGQGGRAGTTWSAAGPLPPAVSWSGPTPLTRRPPAPCPPQAPAPQPCRPGAGPGSGAPQGGQGGGGAQGEASGGWMALGIAALLHGTALMLALDAALRAHTPDTTARHAGWFAWPDGVCLWSARLMVCAAFNLLYIFTPQLLPAQVRALGLGCASSVSRLGALGAPLLALALVERGQAVAALLAFAVMCMAAGAAMQGVAARVAGRGGREG